MAVLELIRVCPTLKMLLAFPGGFNHKGILCFRRAQQPKRNEARHIVHKCGSILEAFHKCFGIVGVDWNTIHDNKHGLSPIATLYLPIDKSPCYLTVNIVT